MKETDPRPNRLMRRAVGVAAVSLMAIFAPQKIDTQSMTTPYVAPYNNEPLQETLANRIMFGQLTDEYCGDPTITGYAALHEVALGLPYNSTLNKIVWLIETDENSDKQVHKLCVFDLEAEEDAPYRNWNSKADVDRNTYSQISPNENIQLTFIDPALTKAPGAVPPLPSDYQPVSPPSQNGTIYDFGSAKKD